jgi:predicted ATPase/class 3 adenylate cyclase
VLFCDLADSSMLASHLDPEELRDVILSYQDACTSAIRRFEGSISRYVGDGILALFGYPRAHEDDAERAVLAALDIVSTVAALRVPGGAVGDRPLAVRVSIATGLVVVGDLIGEGASEEEAVLGETPNLAARLQGLASPNSVVLAAGTRSLIGERFECVDLGTHSLKGFAGPVRAWQARAPRSTGNRFEVAQRVRATPLVDREETLHWLRGLWREVECSCGRVAVLAGEAGIGKSRVVVALREQIVGAQYASLHYQCSPHYVNTALHPVITYIERAAGIGREDTPAVKLEKLSTWVGDSHGTGDAVPLLGTLLSMPPDARYPLPAMSPQRQKERTFELLFGFLQQMAAAWPVPVVFEDVHWMDPTTQEFLALVVERVRGLRALVVITCRQNFSPPWKDQPHVEHRELKKLAPEDAIELVERVAGQRLPRSMIEQVVSRTDGVPLFIEELTKAVVDSSLTDRKNESGLNLAAPLHTIPSTLQDSLMARLDQLGPAKAIAQVAGVIGREFSYELLEAVTPLPANRLREGLLLLERSELVYAQSAAPVASYAFKHALVQEAAYQSLLRSRRRELHLSIAQALESHFPQTTRDTPELVAHHWTEAGNAERAVAAWVAAGERASQRSEYREAIGHLRRGLALISQLADGDARRDRELALLLALGPALIMIEGAGAHEVSALYARALELCEGTPPSAPHFVAHWGWWRASMNHGMGRERADRLLALARNLGEPALLVQAHHCQWATLYMLGAHSECCRHVEAGLDLYDPERHSAHAALYGGHDARVCALGERALACWMLGNPSEALGHAHSALAWAEEVRHVGSRAHAMDYALVLQKFRRDARDVQLRAGELIEFADEQKLRVHRAKGALFRGWARATLEDVQAGLSEMRGGMVSLLEVDTPGDVTVYYEMLAEICGRAGLLEEGLRAVGDGFAVAERHGIVFWNAELYRRRGELQLALGDRSAAAASFQDALTCAHGHGARSLELRAAVSLARLPLEQGKTAAGSSLKPIYETFGEGFDTPDLTEARQLLEAGQ